MLAEERFREIQKYVESHGTVTVQELTDLLNTSESTVRRDLTELHKRGTLIKVHGGATTVGTSVRTRDEELSVRRDRNTEEKHKIAAYAAELIEADDFVYLDAGSSVDLLIDELNRAAQVPLSGGKAMVDREKMIETVEQIKTALPEDITQAQQIKREREEIITEANREAEQLVS